MTTIQVEEEAQAAAADLAQAAALEARSAEAKDADVAIETLAAHANARAEIRSHVARKELGLALRDLAEGLRGVVRAAPLSAVLVGVAAGLAFGGRRARRRVRPRA